MVERKAKSEGWTEIRRKTAEKATEKAIEKTASLIADAAVKNIETVERIKAKLLARLEKLVDTMPENMGSELKLQKDGEVKTYKLHDVVAMIGELSAMDMKRDKLALEKQKMDKWDW